MINDVQIIDLTKYTDNRGFFGEVFRKEWFPDYNHSNIQLNHSFSNHRVLRGLHYHYHQYDYWYVADGQLQVGLIDIRNDSETFEKKMVFNLNRNFGVFIPPGIAHGFIALEDTHLIYVVNNYYDSNDDNELHHSILFDTYMNIMSERDSNAPKLNTLNKSELVFSYR